MPRQRYVVDDRPDRPVDLLGHGCVPLHQIHEAADVVHVVAGCAAVLSDSAMLQRSAVEEPVATDQEI